MNLTPEEEKQKIDAQIVTEEREENSRGEALVYGVALVGFIWWYFNELGNSIQEILGQFLSNFFAIGYSYAFGFAVCGLILTKGMTGSWFKDIQTDDFLQPWKNVLLGILIYFFASTVAIILFWIIFVFFPGLNEKSL